MFLELIPESRSRVSGDTPAPVLTPPSPVYYCRVRDMAGSLQLGLRPFSMTENGMKTGTRTGRKPGRKGHLTALVLGQQKTTNSSGYCGI